MKQGQVEGAARKLLFDDLFEADLGGNPHEMVRLNGAMAAAEKALGR